LAKANHLGRNRELTTSLGRPGVRARRGGGPERPMLAYLPVMTQDESHERFREEIEKARAGDRSALEQLLRRLSSRRRPHR